MGERAQRLKGEANEAAGKARQRVGYTSRRPGTELKGTAQAVKGKGQQAVGTVRRRVKKGKPSV